MSGTEQLNKALKNFTLYFTDICEQKLFNDMLVTVTNVANEAIERSGNQPLDGGGYDECLRQIIVNIKNSKREFGAQLSNLHHLISSLVIALDSSSETKESLNRKIKALSSWLVNFKVEVEHKRTANPLIDFYNELEDLREQLRQLSLTAEELKERNKKHRIDEASLRKEVTNSKKNESRLRKENQKIKERLSEMKTKYSELYVQFSDLLNRKGQPAPKGYPGGATEVTYIKNGDSGAGKADQSLNGSVIDKRYEALLDNQMKIIREKDQRIKELESEIQHLLGKSREAGDLADKDKEKMGDKIRQLEKENLDLRDACIKLKRSLEEMQHQVEQANAARNQLSQWRDKARDNEADLGKLKEKLMDQIGDLEEKNKQLEEKLLKALQRESNYLSGRADSKDLIEGAMIVNQETQEEFNRYKDENDRLKKEVGRLRDRVDLLENELASMLKENEDLKVLAHEKEIDVERFKNDLAKYRKRDDKNRRTKDSLSKKKADLENQLSDKELQLGQLQRQLESQELKMVKMAKLIDRLRFENEKFKNNYRLTQTFSPRKLAARGSAGGTEMPPTMRDLSPEPVRIPSGQKRSRSRSPRENSADRGVRGFRTSTEFNDNVGTYAFIRANSPYSMSPYMYREENKLVIAGPKKGTNYERSPNGSFLDKRYMGFKNVFTQHELDMMAAELNNIMAANNNNMFVIYGEPFNIKLFVMHKTVVSFLSRAETVIQTSESVYLEIIIEETVAEFVVNKFKDEAEMGLCNKTSYKGVYSIVRFDTKIPALVANLRKVFFNILSNSSAKVVDFIAVEVIEQGSARENLKLVMFRSSINRPIPPGKGLQEVLNEFIFSSKYRDIDDLMGVLRDFGVEKFPKQFFLVLEPGKVNTYEMTYNFLDIHSSVENIRVNRRISLRSKQSGVLYT